MPTLKTAMKNAWKNRAVKITVTWLAATYVKFVWASGRWTYQGIEHRDASLSAGGLIACFWHGRLLMMPPLIPKDRTAEMMISSHRDGELIAKTVGHFGIGWIKGSTTRGGATALRGAVRSLRAGNIVGITPDGPRGPRMRATDGVIQLARLSGAPVLPVTFSVRGGKRLTSWDRFMLPYPFGSGYILFGEPMTVPGDTPDEDMVQLRQRLEDRMNDLTAEADRLCGRDPVEPAEAAR